MLGPGLPISLFHHAIVKIDNEKVMVIGGRNGPAILAHTGSDFSAQTHTYNQNYNKWSYGPSLIQGREDHAAGILTDEATLEEFVIITGGSLNGKELKSTEILKRDTWSSGKNLSLSKEAGQRKQEFARLIML